MRTPSLLLTAILLTLPLNAQTIPVNDSVSIDVSVHRNVDHDAAGKSSSGKPANKPVTQNVTMTFTVRGKPKDPESRVVKWVAYGRNLDTKTTTELDSGELKLDLSKLGSQTVTCKPIVTTYAAEHILVPTGKGKSGGGGKVKKAPATGIQYVGYLVRVSDGDVVVGEATDPPGIDKKE